MTAVYVRTQEELDAALANPEYAYESHEIIIDSPEGVWLTINDSCGKDVRAVGSTSVKAWGSTSVKAWDRATVKAWDRATVIARGSATVIARGSATVEAWDRATVIARGSATVEAWDRATVIARDRATVIARGSATVIARDRATVIAWDRATVEAWDRATVIAWDRATVIARGSATVWAGAYVAVRITSKTVTHQGGVIIDMTAVDQTDPATWCAMHLVEVDEDGQAHLYKALDADLYAGHNHQLTRYPIGETVDDTDNWEENNECGGGLHASPTPWLAKTHYENASRFVEVCCPVKDLRPIDESKAKAPRFRVLREVTLDGAPVGGDVA